ncbi:MAG TPA: hypothetical protein VLF67_01105 [Candidatus Saccharimonas sp.]|nr:hypothetical protein [Candidatus Saccharimonas sp.]
MYTHPARVADAIGRRRRDKGLRAAVAEYLGGELPQDWPQHGVIATLNRYLATARVEDVMYAHAAASLDLRPYWPTYQAERFTLANPEKVSYVRPRIQVSQLSVANGWLVPRHQELANCPLGSIRVGQVALTEVHHQVRQAVLPPDVIDNVFDMSAWNHLQAARFGAPAGTRRLAPHYYYGIMALYICHAVLFEDFHGGPNEGAGLDGFVGEVVEPAVKAVTREFGLEPLIVRLPYAPGYLNYPGASAPVFDRHRRPG